VEGFTAQGLSDGDSAEGVSASATGRRTGTYEGTIDIENLRVLNAAGDDVTASYAVTAVPGSLTVTDAESRFAITVRSNSAEYGYDGAAHSAEGFETLTYVLGGQTYTVSGLTTADPSESSAGTYENTISGAAVVTDEEGGDVTDQFDVTIENGSLTINPATVTVSAVSTSKTYGTADPELTVSISGLTAEDAAAAESVITYTIEREAGEDAGSYAIRVSGEETQGSYQVAFTDGTLEILRARATVSANSASKTYGDADPAFTATVTGLTEADAAAGTAAAAAAAEAAEGAVITYTLTRVEGEEAGTYAITAMGEAVQGNYEVTFVPATLTIGAKDVTVRAVNAEKTYGETDPTLTAEVTGLTETDAAAAAAGETIISYELTRADGENAGTYAITAAGAETQGSYRVHYEGSTFTINRAAATVTALDASKTYGDADPALEAEVTGLTAEDAAKGAQAVLAYTIERAAGETAGTYAITVSGEESQGNYLVTYENAAFTIRTRALTLTGHSATIPYTGALLSVEGCTAQGLADGDSADGVSASATGRRTGTYEGTDRHGEPARDQRSRRRRDGELRRHGAPGHSHGHGCGEPLRDHGPLEQRSVRLRRHGAPRSGLRDARVRARRTDLHGERPDDGRSDRDERGHL